jgi:allantoinase
LGHIAAARERGGVWFTTPGAICEHVAGLAAAQPADFA